MEVIVGFIVIAAIAYIGSVYMFSKEKLPTTLRYLFYSGWEFILLGVAIGPLAMGLFPDDMLGRLNPVIYLGLGWVGLLFGVQLRYADLARLDKSHLLVTFMESLLTGLLVLACTYPILAYFFSWPAMQVLMVSMVVAASAALSSPTLLVLLHKETGYKERVIRLLQIMTNLDAALPVFALGLAFTLFRGGTHGLEAGAFLFLQAVAMGLLLGFLFYLLPRKKLTENEQFVVLIGFVFFSSGVAGVLQVPPLFMNFISGIFLANTLKKDDSFYTAIFHAERPFYVIMLLLSGLLLTLPGTVAFFLLPVLVLVRLFGKYFFVSGLVRRFEPGFHFPPNGGVALASQGAMALAVAFSFHTVYKGEAGDMIFSIIVIGMMINEMIAPFLISKVFRGSE